MPRVSRFDLPPLDLGGESIGQRLSRLRHRRVLSQTQVARRIGIVQGLVSEYERDQLKLSAEMAMRFVQALKFGIEELLGPAPSERRPTLTVVGRTVQAREGQDRLTPREVDIVRYLERRWTNAEIAQETGLRENTVKRYVASILEKTGASSRHELALDRPRKRIVEPASRPA